MNRRNLFRLAAGTAAAELTSIDRVRAAAAAAKDRTPEEIAADEDFWAEVRSAFTVDRNIVNLNNGHVSPSPRAVQEAMRRYLEYSDTGPYHTMIAVLERRC